MLGVMRHIGPAFPQLMSHYQRLNMGRVQVRQLDTIQVFIKSEATPYVDIIARDRCAIRSLRGSDHRSCAVDNGF
jgi:hypothetical protein